VLPTSGEVGPGVPAFVVRPGYRVTVAAESIPDLRFIEFDDKGTLYVSQPGRGAVVTLRLGADGKYTQIAEFVTGTPARTWHEFPQRLVVVRAERLHSPWARYEQ
jgi:hypothetical protein